MSGTTTDEETETTKGATLNVTTTATETSKRRSCSGKVRGAVVTSPSTVGRTEHAIAVVQDAGDQPRNTRKMPHSPIEWGAALPFVSL